VFEALGTRCKQFRLLGTADGFAIDYAHGDMLIAEDADTEVYPLVATRLSRQVTRQSRPTGYAISADAGFTPVNHFDPYTRRLRRRFADRAAEP